MISTQRVGGQKNRFKDNIKSIVKRATYCLSGWRLLHPTKLPGDLPLPSEFHILMLNMIVLQLDDAVAYAIIPQLPALF